MYQPSVNSPDINRIPIAMYSCVADTNWTMHYLSESFSTLFGHCNEDLLRNRKTAFSELIHPDDLASTYNLLTELEDGRTFELQFRLKRADGNYIRVEDRGIVTKNETNWQVEGVLIPLENPKSNALHPKKAEDLSYSDLFDLSPNLVCFIDEEGNFNAVNNTFVKQLGYNKQEFYSRPVLSFVHENDRKVSLKKIEYARAGGTVVNFRNRLLAKDGSTLNILWTVSRGKRVRKIYAVGQDITEIIDKKQRLKESNQRFSLAAAASNEMIWEWQPKKGVVQRTGNYEALLGKTAAAELQLDPERWFRRIHPDDFNGFKNSLDIALKNPEAKQWEYEYRILNKDGNYAYIADRGKILRDAEGRPTRVVGAALDISRSKDMINEITRQNAQLRKIAWTQSHKLRAPLARAMGLFTMLQEQDFDPMTHEELLDNIGVSLNELDDIIREIVDTTYS